MYMEVKVALNLLDAWHSTTTNDKPTIFIIRIMAFAAKIHPNMFHAKDLEHRATE